MPAPPRATSFLLSWLAHEMYAHPLASSSLPPKLLSASSSEIYSVSPRKLVTRRCLPESSQVRPSEKEQKHSGLEPQDSSKKGFLVHRGATIAAICWLKGRSSSFKNLGSPFRWTGGNTGKKLLHSKP